MGDVSKRMLPWRILDDKKLVCLNNALVPLCEVMRQMSADHGLVDVQLLDHSLNPKMRPAFWFQSDQTFMFDYSCLMLFGASFTLFPIAHHHLLQIRSVPQAANESEPVAAPFRFNVEPVNGNKTHCFRPNGVDGQDLMNLKHQVFGGVFKNNYDRGCDNLRASVVWEATLFRVNLPRV